MSSANPLDEVVDEAGSDTLDRCMRNDPKTVTDEDLDRMVSRLRRDRSVFIAAGEKKPKKGEEDGAG